MAEGPENMNTVTVPPEIDYPESDGKPMGETELHRDWTIRILDILRQRYSGQAVHVASDLLGCNSNDQTFAIRSPTCTSPALMTFA